ncbi:hypothetical protein V2J09_018314 [Rumex salicifolius]
MQHGANFFIRLTQDNTCLSQQSTKQPTKPQKSRSRISTSCFRYKPSLSLFNKSQDRCCSTSTTLRSASSAFSNSKIGVG